MHVKSSVSTSSHPNKKGEYTSAGRLFEKVENKAEQSSNKSLVLQKSTWTQIAMLEERDLVGEEPTINFFNSIEKAFPGTLKEGQKQLADIAKNAGASPLRIFRLRAGFSQADLAKLAKVGQDVISNLENNIGARNPCHTTMENIKQALNLTPKEAGEAFFS
jgi:hypothetical protein